MSTVKVIMKQRKKEDKGPTYVTICMKPHWDSEGVMCTSGTWDATKFAEDDTDANLFCNYLNKVSKDFYEIVQIDERHLSSLRNEYWSDRSVHCDFKVNHLFKGEKL